MVKLLLKITGMLKHCPLGFLPEGPCSRSNVSVSHSQGDCCWMRDAYSAFLKTEIVLKTSIRHRAGREIGEGRKREVQVSLRALMLQQKSLV